MSAQPSPLVRPSGHLNTGAAVLWRDTDVVQLELGHRRLVLDQLDTHALAQLLGPGPDEDASPDRASPAHPVDSGDYPPDPTIPKLRHALCEAGLLTVPDPVEAHEPQLSARLWADRSALAADFGGQADQVLHARANSIVIVRGRSRIAAGVASTLAAAGLGWVHVATSGEVSAAETCPGGLDARDEGRRFALAGAEAVHRVAPTTETARPGDDRQADLVVLTDPSDTEAIAPSLQRDGIAHLEAGVTGRHAVIGPLVVPGSSSCLNCADLHRRDRDPGWPLLAVQLTANAGRRISSDVALCVATAGVVAQEVLSFLDSGGAATMNGTLEWQLPDFRLRRRSWPPHPACGCGVSAGSLPRLQNGEVIRR
ncbi:ThiF family adenylyltransferase [Jatrophihabitans telluris]|uniref:ThiF family adenylyltransferase n=1 Tax=Jatrophihabitans telluris TaxID=2038343 RepID=A0ABY4R2G2_9ACTN|nr:ThiF family adenylyltransferase [Jatrophihabitans telluris]UQX89732.1 ThiF family adenylyltransferase [Jatrophihabitans telluris]